MFTSAASVGVLNGTTRCRTAATGLGPVVPSLLCHTFRAVKSLRRNTATTPASLVARISEASRWFRYGDASAVILMSVCCGIVRTPVPGQILRPPRTALAIRTFVRNECPLSRVTDWNCFAVSLRTGSREIARNEDRFRSEEPMVDTHFDDSASRNSVTGSVIVCAI